MIETLQSFDLSMELWMLVALCGVIIGLAKGGVGGVAMLAVPIMAGIFGGRPSVGLLLPMLCIGDVFGVTYYHSHAEWHYIWRLMPWAIVGIAIGLYVGNRVSGDQFRHILAVVILVSVSVLLWQEYNRGNIAVPDTWWFSALMGLAGGFTTMIGNVARLVMVLYLLSMRLPKYSFIGTQAWFFLIVNLLKVPLHVFFWHTISVRTLSLDAAMIPVIAAGAFLGVKVVRKIPEKPYRIFIMSMTMIAALKLFF